jgi:hypothetical protein
MAYQKTGYYKTVIVKAPGSRKQSSQQRRIAGVGRKHQRRISSGPVLLQVLSHGYASTNTHKKIELVTEISYKIFYNNCEQEK